MSTPRIAVAVIHAKDRGREAMLERVCHGLGPLKCTARIVDEPAPCHVWSEIAWRHLAESDATHGLVLQDDVELCRDFAATLAAVVGACPKHVVALNHCQLGGWPRVALGKGYRWVTSHDGLVGHGYIMPRAAYAALLDWRTTELTDAQRAALHEDEMINLWAMDRRLLVWHPVPALLDHPPNESTWCNPDDPSSLRPSVPPREGMAALDWAGDAVHAGRARLGQHRRLVETLAVTPARLERYFELEGRRG